MALSRLEEEGYLDVPYGAMAPRTLDIDEVSTSDSGSEDGALDADDDAASKLASSPPPPTGTPEPAPEVKCLWEDCGQTFTDLQPFIEHLHSCMYLC